MNLGFVYNIIILMQIRLVKERVILFENGAKIRAAVRSGEFTGHTSGYATGCVQANLVVLQAEWAYDFLLFAQRNPKPCPILEVGDKGSYLTNYIAEDADIRSDIPKYRIYENGSLTSEVNDITRLWQDDFVYFLLGCSFSFEQALIQAGLEIRHIEENVNVPMFTTNIKCKSAGKFKETPMVVSMRPFASGDAVKAVEITRDYPAVHGSPVHIGDPAQIGISDINKPDFGDRVTIKDGELPVFWACGVTPQNAAVVAKPPLMITHSPGHMFVGDMKDHEFKI